MKKLLSILSSTSLIAASAQLAVSCGKNYDVKDKDGNSILIKFLQKINGKIEISSVDVLLKLFDKDNGPKNKEKLLLDLLKMMNISFLINSEEKDFVDENIYSIPNFKELLNEKWLSLNSAIDRQISDEKEKYKKDHGKNWQKEWDKMLVNKFSVYQDDVKKIDRDFLEKKYKANILLTDSNNNASKALIDLLINTNQLGVTWIGYNEIKNKYNALNSTINDSNDNNNKIALWIKGDLKQLEQIKNSKENDPSKWVALNINEKSSDEDIAREAKKIINDIKVDDIKNDVPVNIGEFSKSDTNNSRAGFLSNSQRFFLDNFYTTQAPLAISEITIPFSDNKSFDNGVIPDDFHSLDGIDQKNSEKLLTLIAADNDGNNWRRWMVEGKVDNLPKFKVKHYDNLMTLSESSDFSQDMRSIVYDFVLNETNKRNGKPIQLGGSTIDDPKTNTPKLDNLVKELSRSKSKESKDFYRFDEKSGKVYYIDSSGLHIVQIDGYKYLQEGKKEGKKQGGIDKDSKKINKDTITELNNFKKFNLSTNNEKINIMKNQDENSLYNKLNSTIVNPYLHYLVNKSMLKGISEADSSFDIMSKVKSWAQVSANDDSNFYWSTCLFEYFLNISNEKNIEKFIKKYITFNDFESNSNNVNVFKSWFYEAINTKSSSSSTKPAQQFLTSQNKWIEDIKSKTDDSQYPKLEFDIKDKKNITLMANNKFWKPEDKKNRTILNFANCDFFNYFETKLIINRMGDKD